MPHLTPSRVAVFALTLMLMTFLWSIGLPEQPASPALPAVNHDRRPGKPQPRPLAPPPRPESPLQDPAVPPEAKPLDSVKGGDKNAALDLEKTEKPISGGEGPGAGQEKQTEPTPTTFRKEIAPSPAAVGSSQACKDVRGAANIMVILKTSKAEMADKLPPHLKTLFSCVPNVAIFSDHASTIDGFPVYNALDVISTNTSKHYDEFREYGKIQADKNYKPSVEKTKNLDKWKFLPMVYKAFKMRPDSRFYLFIETDTSVSWTNLLQWLDRLDYRIPYYSGAPMYQGETHYAQRGPGILLSYGALRQYAKMYEERYASDWEPYLGEQCCGDKVLAGAMAESAVEFYPAFPLLQGETPSTFDWTEGHWCAPIVSWHGMTPDEADQLWRIQQEWTHKYGWDVPYLLRNAFSDFVLPHFTEKRDDWDNISSDTVVKGEIGRKEKLAKQKLAKELEREEQKLKEQPPKDESHAPETPPFEPPAALRAVPVPRRRARRDAIDWDAIGATITDASDSAANCQALCQKTNDCLQWKYTPAGEGECHLGKVLRLGRKAEGTAVYEKWTSGWIVERIKKVTERWGECERPNWKFHQ